MTHFVVTGCAGFIGSHLVDRLLAEGHRVVGVDSFSEFYSSSLKRKNINQAWSNKNFTLVEADIRSKRSLDLWAYKHCSLDSVIIHLAAVPGVQPSFVYPDDYIDTNIVGTKNVLELALKLNVKKLVFASSSSVYGNNTVPFSEDQIVHPISIYGATKSAGEDLCKVYYSVFGIGITCLRFFTVYGPRQRPDLAIHKFVRALHYGEPIHVHNGGTVARDFTYVDDIVDGIIRAVPLPGFEIINLGNSRTVEVRALVSALSEITVLPAITHEVSNPPGNALCTHAAIDKAQKLLGWAPKTDLTLGLTNFVKWYRKEYM